MYDWLGFGFFALLLVGVFFGIRALANQKPRTAEEFERNAAENSTMAGALLNALHDVTDPAAQRAKEVRMQIKDGRSHKKRKEGKAGGDADIKEP